MNSVQTTISELGAELEAASAAARRLAHELSEHFAGDQRVFECAGIASCLQAKLEQLEDIVVKAAAAEQLERRQAS